MPYLKEGQLRQRVTPTVGTSDQDSAESQYSAPVVVTWVKTNWMYLVGVIGAVIIISLLIYFYKKGMVFGSQVSGGVQYY